MHDKYNIVGDTIVSPILRYCTDKYSIYSQNQLSDYANQLQ